MSFYDELKAQITVERKTGDTWQLTELNDQTEEGVFRVYNPFTRQHEDCPTLFQAKDRFNVQNKCVENHRDMMGELAMKVTRYL